MASWSVTTCSILGRGPCPPFTGRDPRRRHLHEPVRAGDTETGPVSRRRIGPRAPKSTILGALAIFE